MILYRKEPYPLQMKNIILLDSGDGGVVYVNKDTYDQALLLSARFDGSVSRIEMQLKNRKTEGYMNVKGLKPLIDEMVKIMPKPLNVLAPFLMYCAENEGINWEAENNKEIAYGVLHQYSQIMDFNAVMLVPIDIRSSISIPTSILMQYETAWKEMCSALEEKVAMTYTQPTQSAPVIQSKAQSTTPVPAPAPSKPITPPTQSMDSFAEQMAAAMKASAEDTRNRLKASQAAAKKETETTAQKKINEEKKAVNDILSSALPEEDDADV